MANRAPIRLVRSDGQATDERPPVDIQPELRISPDSRAVNVDRLDAAAHALPNVYQRSLGLVQIVEEQRPQLVAEGSPVIRPLNVHSLGTIIDRNVRCLVYRPKQREYFRGPCPVEIALLPFLHFGEWRGVRPISSVVEAPFFRPDGSVWQTAGYDPGTGYLYRPNGDFPRVAESPTRRDAEMALVSLRHVFCDFPYVSDAASIVPIACLLTILARAAIMGCVPMFLFEASVQGSGKTKQGDAVHIIATGRLPPHSTYPADETDQRKELLTMALSGAPVYFLDNVKGVFGGAPIEATVTSGELRQRLLGRSEDAIVRWLATVIATGNNMRPTRDVLRRSLISRLEPDVEDPSKGRTFQHHPLLPWVFAERPRLIVAALTILRAYACHGYPDAGTGRMESFDEWAQLVPGAIAFAGGPNCLDAIGQPEDAGTDDAEAVATIVRDLPRLSPDPISCKAMLASLYSKQREAGEPDGFDDLRTAIETLAPSRHGPPTPKALGDALKSVKGQVSAGHKLQCQKHVGTKRWYVEPVRRR